ncbi:MAG: RdgB/HAM1 family non-canonical purine NTP pyrophosphatase [Polyangiaceae bacterium]
MPGGGYRETLVVATSNRGKLEELRALFAGLALEVRAASELLGESPNIVEDGSTFVENAVKKARAVARATMTLTLADDSGLEVDALDGRPGVKSARFAHDRATDAENNAALLSALDAFGDPADVPRGGFPARFRCALALVDPFTGGGEPRTVEGVCEGAITRTPRGSGGFGYDPLFVVAGTDKTMAELHAEEKNRVSHRARAFSALQPILERVLADRATQLERIP